MERQFENLLFVANEFPEIITDEEYEIQKYVDIQLAIIKRELEL